VSSSSIDKTDLRYKADWPVLFDDTTRGLLQAQLKRPDDVALAAGVTDRLIELGFDQWDRRQRSKVPAFFKDAWLSNCPPDLRHEAERKHYKARTPMGRVSVEMIALGQRLGVRVGYGGWFGRIRFAAGLWVFYAVGEEVAGKPATREQLLAVGRASTWLKLPFAVVPGRQGEQRLLWFPSEAAGVPEGSSGR
jgi:hypothetical protein